MSADWLWISVQSGKRKIFEPYILHKSGQRKEASRGESKSTQNTSEFTHKPSLPEANADSRVGGRSFGASEMDGLAAGEAFQPAKLSLSDRKKDSLFSVSQPEKKESDNKDDQRTEVHTEDSGTSVHSHRSSENIESSMNIFLKKAREITRPRSTLSEDNGTRRRRPNLGRTNSSARNEFKRADSRVSVSSIDTMNEDGYGSAVSADTDAINPLTAKLSRNFTGQSLSSLLSSGKFTRYIDSPIPENNELLDDENGTPAMTQLNYEDPNAMAAREEIMRLARRGNVDEAHVTKILKQKEAIQPQAVVDEFPQLVDRQGGRMTARRTRRSAGKQQEDDFL